MGVGTVSAHALADIAEAIRRKAGTSRALHPHEMAAAVAALDGTDAGAYAPRAFSGPERGLLSESVMTGIANAIRAQSGEERAYAPGEMAAAMMRSETGSPRLSDSHPAILPARATSRMRFGASTSWRNISFQRALAASGGYGAGESAGSTSKWARRVEKYFASPWSSSRRDEDVAMTSRCPDAASVPITTSAPGSAAASRMNT